MQNKSDVDVLIVGAGPTGLTLACELQRRHIAVKIIEKRAGISMKSRATNVQARTFELFHFMGIEKEFLKEGKKLQAGRIFIKEKELCKLNISQLPLTYPFVLIVPQSKTETILTHHLQKLGGEVVYQKELIDFREMENGIHYCTIKDNSSNTEVITTKYLISCEGAHSRIRSIADIHFDGMEYTDDFLLADATLDWNKSRKESYTWFYKDGVFITMPLPNSDHWRLFTNLPTHKNKKNINNDTAKNLALLQELFTERTGDKHTKIGKATWVSNFKIGRRIAATFKKGKVLLAGDAAHIHNPLGGQGFNVGIQDAFNIAWKLALVLEKKAVPELLETYEEERRPIVETILESTHYRSMLTFPKNNWLRFLRDHMLPPLIKVPFIQKVMLQNASQLHLHYTNSQLSKTQISTYSFFRKTLKAGQRVPNSPCLFNQQTTHIFSILNTPHFTLLFFVPSHNQLTEFKTWAKEYFSTINAYIVLPKATKDYLYPTSQIIIDHTNTLYQQFGIKKTSDALCLIRPDGYIAYYSVPANWLGLQQYLITSKLQLSCLKKSTM